MFSIIFYMYTRLNTPIATSLISQNTGLTEAEVDACMEILCENNLAEKSVIETVGGNINSYIFILENAVIPMLCFADELTRPEQYDFLWSFSRTKPLFR